MKKLFTVIGFLLVLSCKQQRPGDEFIGKWTDGTWRHIVITTARDGYTVEDVSEGHKKFHARYVDQQLVVETPKISIFNYIKAQDKILASRFIFYREN